MILISCRRVGGGVRRVRTNSLWSSIMANWNANDYSWQYQRGRFLKNRNWEFIVDLSWIYRGSAKATDSFRDLNLSCNYSCGLLRLRVKSDWSQNTINIPEVILRRSWFYRFHCNKVQAFLSFTWYACQSGGDRQFIRGPTPEDDAVCQLVVWIDLRTWQTGTYSYLSCFKMKQLRCFRYQSHK